MPVSGPIPEHVLTIVAVATLCTMMFEIGLGIVPGEWRWVWRHPLMLAKGLASAVLLVPPIALAVSRACDLSRPVEIGIMLMAISPGAPLALRRALGAGGHRAFAPALQMSLAVAAVVSMPLWVATLNVVYSGHARIEPEVVARQVFLAQVLPLALGIAAGRLLPWAAEWAPRLSRVSTWLIALFVILASIDVWPSVLDAGPRVGLAIVLITGFALWTGSILGSPYAGARTAIAISTALRNPGLALLVAARNDAAPEVVATVLAYLVISALAVVPYVKWRRRPLVMPRPAR